jgi:hypothetical protein
MTKKLSKRTISSRLMTTHSADSLWKVRNKITRCKGQGRRARVMVRLKEKKKPSTPLSALGKHSTKKAMKEKDENVVVA